MSSCRICGSHNGSYECCHHLASHLMHTGFVARLIFNSEKGGDIFLRNVGSHRTTQHYILEDDKIH
jgi:hypothetical protein